MRVNKTFPCEEIILFEWREHHATYDLQNEVKNNKRNSKVSKIVLVNKAKILKT